MTEKQIRNWLLLGFGAVIVYKFISQHHAATQLATIQPLSPNQIATPDAVASLVQNLKPSIMS